MNQSASLGTNKTGSATAPLLQSLEGILLAELADNDCWEALSELAQRAGEKELEEQFLQTYTTEQEHLEKVRSWLAAGHGRTQPNDGSGGNGRRKSRVTKRS